MTEKFDPNHYYWLRQRYWVALLSIGRLEMQQSHLRQLHREASGVPEVQKYLRGLMMKNRCGPHGLRALNTATRSFRAYESRYSFEISRLRR